MEQEQKTSPVEIVQKLLAIHITRKEVCEKMVQNQAAENLREKLKSIDEQSDRFIKALLNELSQFGDAVQSEVDRKDEFHENWNNAVKNIDIMDSASLAETSEKLENNLINIYAEIKEQNNNLPETLDELLTVQINELKQSLQ